LRPDRPWAEIRLRDRALATSGGTFQSFRHEGKRYVHILDPRTGRPAEGVLSVTVVAPAAALADALSTAFFVLGPHRAAEFCRRREEIAAIVAVADSGGDGFRVHTAGFREGEIRFVS
jgi:thiamine biosynthesis lipoprotein